MSVPLGQWQEIWHREYLVDYIPSGGSAVKILVADKEDLNKVVESTAATACNADFITVVVDSSTTKCHLVQEIFFAVSRQIDWETPVDKWLCRFLEHAGYVIPNGVPLNDLESIAAASGVSEITILKAAVRLIEQHVMNDRSLWYPFRITMAAFCNGRFGRGGISDQDTESIMGWLRGENTSLSRLRRLRITERIGRHNARPILISLARWCNKLGIPGICIVMNLSAVYSSGDSIVRYTRTALLDLYEMLRQFIDETEEMSNLAIVAVASRGITDDPKVSYDNYDAFKMRVVNDVRDRIKDNPLNTLVTVGITEKVSTAE
jgi:hypothetical protein